MNKAIFLCLTAAVAVFSLFACKKEKNLTSDDPIDQMVDTSAPTLVLRQGVFVSNAHPTTGSVTLMEQNGGRLLQLNNFRTDNGPDLRVYLSASLQAADFTDLGTLKSVNGNFFYTVPASVNIDNQRFVLIWCEDFSILFGHAELN